MRQVWNACDLLRVFLKQLAPTGCLIKYVHLKESSTRPFLGHWEIRPHSCERGILWKNEFQALKGMIYFL